MRKVPLFAIDFSVLSHERFRELCLIVCQLPLSCEIAWSDTGVEWLRFLERLAMFDGRYAVWRRYNSDVPEQIAAAEVNRATIQIDESLRQAIHSRVGKKVQAARRIGKQRSGLGNVRRAKGRTKIDCGRALLRLLMRGANAADIALLDLLPPAMRLERGLAALHIYYLRPPEARRLALLRQELWQLQNGTGEALLTWRERLGTALASNRILSRDYQLALVQRLLTSVNELFCRFSI